MSQIEKVTIEALEQRVSKIFQKVGALSDVADCLAHVIVAGERDHCAAHGLYRIEGCLRTIKAGQVKPDVKPELMSSEGAIVKIDAKMGFSNPAFYFGLPMLVEKAKEFGPCRDGPFRIARISPRSGMKPRPSQKNGLAGLAMCPSYATVAPFGGNAPLLGTNPLAFGWPRPQKDPYVFDFATSMAARGEIELYNRAGKQLPEGWGIDKDGNAQHRACCCSGRFHVAFWRAQRFCHFYHDRAACRGHDWRPYKPGSAWKPWEPQRSHRITASLFWRWIRSKFAAGRNVNPFDRAEMMLDAIAGQGARLPSQRRFSARKETLAEGIMLDEKQQALLVRFEKDGLDAVSL